MDTSGKTRILAAGIWVSVFIIILFMNFSNLISNEALTANQKLMQELSVRSAGVLREKITLDTKLLKGIAENIYEESDFTSPQTSNLLRAMAKQTDFARIVIINTDGKTVVNENQVFNSAGNQALQRILAGETVITGSFSSQRDQKTSNAILIPLYDKNKEVMGILCGIHNIERWSKLLDYSFGYNQVYFHVLSGDGHYVFNSKIESGLEERQSTMHDLLSNATFLEGFSHEKVHEEMENGKSGFAAIEISLSNQERSKTYLSYAPVGVNDWYVFALIPQEIVNDKSELVKNLGRELLFKVVGLFFLLIVYIAIEMSKTTRAIALSKERYRIAIEQADTIIFDYDIRTDMMYNSSQLDKNFRMWSNHSLNINEICHPDDIDSLKNFIKKFAVEQKEMNIDCRFKYKDDTYKWNKFSLIPIFDASNKLEDAIGILEDITELKIAEEKLLQAEQHSKILKEKAEIDHLTGLFNKGAVEYLVGSILQGNMENIQAFIIVDLDNFKAINDNFGHATGDEVLRKVANCLKSIFRNTDIVGRIGGDEFVVFLRDPSNMEIVICKMQEICDRLVFIYTKEDKEYKVSASVGCAIYPKDGKKFVDLYKKADAALYVAKRHGKGIFSISE